MTFLLAIAALLVIVWGIVFAFRGSMLLGSVALLIIAYVAGHNLVSFDLGPLPMTLDRLVLGGLLVTLMLQWWSGQLKLTRLLPVDYVLLAFIGCLIVSTFTHDWRVSRPGRISPLWLLVAGYLTPICLYFFARFSPLNPRAIKWVYVGMACFGVYLTVTALAEITQQWWLVFPGYISDPRLGIHFGRARGPHLQAHSMGFQTATMLLCGWALWPHVSRKWQLVMLAMFPLTMLAIYFCYTRCIWMGAALATVIVLSLSLKGAWRPIVLAGTTVGGLLVAVVFWNQIVGIEREAGAEAARDSVSQRASFTWVSWTMFQDRPFFGFGFGQFTDAKWPYLSDRSVPFYLEAIRTQPHHNTFLSVLVETGLVGLCLFLSLLAGWGWLGWKLWRNQRLPQIQRTQGLVMLGMLGIYSQPALFFDLAYSPSDHWVTFFLAGITVGLYAQVTEEEKNSRTDETSKKRPSSNQDNISAQPEGPRLYQADVLPAQRS
jgi:O-antigen ligase